MRPDRRPHHPTRGAAAVEFALTLPVLLAIGAAVLDYAWYLNRSADVLSAVREGTRVAATVAQEDDPEATAVARTESALTGYGLTCTSSTCVTAVLGSVDDMTTIQVTAQVEYDPIIGLVPTPATMGATLVMALEDQSGP